MARHGMDVFAHPEAAAGIFFDDFLNALGAWTALQDEPPTIERAMRAFNVTEDVVAKAVEDHYWLILCGPEDDPLRRTIHCEGE